MAKFYVVTKEIVEKTICIEVDTESKLEAKKAYIGPEGDFRTISEEETDWFESEFRSIYTEKEYLG